MYSHSERKNENINFTRKQKKMGNKKKYKIGFKKHPTRKKKLSCKVNIIKRFNLETFRNTSKCESAAEPVQGIVMRKSTNVCNIKTQQQMKVKRTFPTLHQLFDILLTEDEDSDDADSDATRSATENDVEDEIQNTSKVFSNVTDRTKSQNKYIKSHIKAHKIRSRTTGTKHQLDSRNSRKRKHNKVAGNTKKPTTVQGVNIPIDEPTIHLTETSPAYNDPLYIDYTIKTEPVGEDNTENSEIIDTNELIIEDDIKQEVKEESDDEDMSDDVSAARVTYLCRAPSNIK